MNVQDVRWLLVTIFVLVVAGGCSPATSLPSSRLSCAGPLKGRPPARSLGRYDVVGKLDPGLR